MEDLHPQVPSMMISTRSKRISTRSVVVLNLNSFSVLSMPLTPVHLIFLYFLSLVRSSGAAGNYPPATSGNSDVNTSNGYRRPPYGAPSGQEGGGGGGVGYVPPPATQQQQRNTNLYSRMNHRTGALLDQQQQQNPSKQQQQHQQQSYSGSYYGAQAPHTRKGGLPPRPRYGSAYGGGGGGSYAEQQFGLMGYLLSIASPGLARLLNGGGFVREMILLLYRLCWWLRDLLDGLLHFLWTLDPSVGTE